MSRTAPAGPAGVLVVVGTPIGNLGDLAPRAAEALAGADVVYCEDTRRTRQLLTHAGISGVPLRSLHGHNETARVDEVVAAVAGGRTVALVSDAGMPAVSDPGERVVAATAAAGLAVTVVPGPSSVLVALVASGLPADRFCFEGFLPRTGRDRAERLGALAAEARTSVLLEAPGRVAGTLDDLVGVCGGDRPVAVCRELTKVHEEVRRGRLADVAARAATDAPRGEVVLVLGGAPAGGPPSPSDAELTAALAAALAGGERVRGAVDEVAGAFGVPRRRVYGLALARREQAAAAAATSGEDPGAVPGPRGGPTEGPGPE